MNTITGAYVHKLPEPSWEQRFDDCMRRLRQIDAEEAELHRSFIADMRGLIDTMEAALAPELTEGE